MAARGLNRPLRLVAGGDVGRVAAYHVGDEAMLRGLIEAAKRADVAVEWTVMSSDPARTAADWGVRATPRLSFEDCAGPAEREARLAALTRLLQATAEPSPESVPAAWRESLTAIAECDGVVVAGGGNLNRSWPAEVFERVAVARAAERARRRLAITSQTIGPAFDERTRELTAELLRRSAFVGLREASSFELALELGAPPDRTVLQFDDATGLAPVEPPWWRDVAGDGPFIAVTVNQIGEAAAAADIAALLAQQLVEVSRLTGAAIVLVPHVGDLDGTPAHDVAMAQAIAAAAGDPLALRVAPLPTPGQAVWISAHAQLVVSTRYHPVVFAIATTTPSLFLHQNFYTLVKGSGALRLAGLSSWTLPVAAAASGLLVPAAMELWARRHDIRSHLAALAPTIETTRRRHVTTLLSVLGSPEHWSAGEPMPVTSGPVARGDWVERVHEGAATASPADIRLHALERDVDRKDAEMLVAQAALVDLTKSAQDAHAAWEADRETLLSHCEQLERRAATAEEYAGALANEIERKETDLKIAAAALAGVAAAPVEKRTRLDACTIVARNYLPYARVLAESLTAMHPECRVTVLVVDGQGDPSDRSRFRTLQLDDIMPDADERSRQTFMYDVTELSTAVKPLLLRYLLAEGAPSVLYFDPDIEIFGPVDHLWSLAERHHVVLTPHVLTPIPDDGHEVSDLAVLRAGVFNLGFIGVGDGSDDFLEWWTGRLRRHCLSDPCVGMFVDQRWLDYVAAVFPHVVERDEGLNVAYWNLHERRVVQTETGFTVNDTPLRFYHFSGFDPDVPYLLSRHQGSNPRALLSEQPAVQELCRRYAARLRAKGYGAVPVPYAFSALPDGTHIDFVMRRLYRRALLQAEATHTPTPPSPFGSTGILEWLNSPAPESPKLTRYLFGLYQERADLRRTFPEPFGRQADDYLHWVAYDPLAIRSIPASLRPPSPAVGSGAGPPALRDGLNVAGYFKAELGVGEVARLVVAAARAEGLPVATAVNDRTLSRQNDTFEGGGHDGPFSTTLVCANADEFPRAVDALPVRMREAGYRIGFWFWETERLPEVYQRSSSLLDEIWVASEYVAEAVGTYVTKPVRICPLPVRQIEPAPLSRAELGVPEGFVFLFMFDFLSSVHRKNPIGLVDAFCRAFGPGEGPTLVLKSINGPLARGAQEALRAAIGSRTDVIAVDGYMAAATRDALMHSCDCYVSLHRAEGFGLTLADAMALGKPTIATAYSGNLAFMTAENSFLVPYRRASVPAGCAPYPEGDWWAEPDLDRAASLMRTVYENPALAKDRGDRGRVDVLNQCSPARTVAFIRGRLAEIRQRHDAEAAAVLPPVTEPAPPETEALPPAPLDDAPAQTVVDDSDRAALEALCEQLRLAEHEAAEAERMVADGIAFRTPSRYGFPGQLLRTAVLRLIRPYVHFEARAHRRHLESTQRIIEYLRSGVASRSIDRQDGEHQGRD